MTAKQKKYFGGAAGRPAYYPYRSAAAPGNVGKTKPNPKKFDRCVKKVKAKGGAKNAYAVCTAAGTRNPAYAIIEKPRGGKAREIGRYDDKARAEQHARDLSLHFSTTGTKWTVKKVATKRNPASASAEVFEDFHGYPPSEVVTVTKDIHRHAHLASLGALVSLDVWGVDGRGHKITGFKKALLCSNEDRNQLFIEGGDQSVNLRDFGIKSAHEMETLGTVTGIAYQTNKTHLGDEGGHAVYVHKFRTTNENGKHVTIRMAREPDLVYDVRNEQLLFSGGSYTILREGIDK